MKDKRRYIDYGSTYEEGMRLRLPRRSSPARVEFKAQRAARRLARFGGM
ncbi:MAG: hypothetical protein ACRDNS_13530 [Trebonia sp.]